MSFATATRPQPRDSKVVEDNVMARLEQEALAEAALTGVMGGGGDVEEHADDDAPYDLEVMYPRAASVRELCRRAGKEVAPEVGAALGPREPLLIWHGVTAFAKQGQRPPHVWGMGYTVRLDGVSAATVAVAPASFVRTVATMGQELQLGIGVGGEIEVPPVALAPAGAVPGVSFTGARLEATTDTRLVLSLRADFAVLDVQAGPVGAGGARWNLYRTGARLDRFQPLVQTLLVEPGIRALPMSVTTWVRRRRSLRGLGGTRHWDYQPQAYEVSLEGLSP
jgi:hypothetical protein